jgi:hypothetical protein
MMNNVPMSPESLSPAGKPGSPYYPFSGNQKRPIDETIRGKNVSSTKKAHRHCQSFVEKQHKIYNGVSQKCAESAMKCNFVHFCAETTPPSEVKPNQILASFEGIGSDIMRD